MHTNHSSGPIESGYSGTVAPLPPELSAAAVRGALAEYRGITGEAVAFTGAILGAYQEEFRSGKIYPLSYESYEGNTELARQHSRPDLDPEKLPPHLAMVPTERWTNLPLDPDAATLQLWSAANRGRIEEGYQTVNDASLKQNDMSAIAADLEREILAASAPLVHGTTYETLNDIIDTGSISSNRSVLSKGDEYVGQTHAEDRVLGLDDYVFFDWGRPTTARLREQPEITLVVSQDALKCPGAFVTENDIEMYAAYNNPAERYLNGFLRADDFEAVRVKAVETKWQDDPRHNNVTSPHFTQSLHRLSVYSMLSGGRETINPTELFPTTLDTFEVKIPVVSADKIKRIIFRDPAQYSRFIQEHDNDFDCVLNPDMGRNFSGPNGHHGDANVDIFGTFETARTVTESAVTRQVIDGYTRRKKSLASVNPENIVTGTYLVLDARLIEDPLCSYYPPGFRYNEYDDRSGTVGPFFVDARKNGKDQQRIIDKIARKYAGDRAFLLTAHFEQGKPQEGIYTGEITRVDSSIIPSQVPNEFGGLPELREDGVWYYPSLEPKPPTSDDAVDSVSSKGQPSHTPPGSSATTDRNRRAPKQFVIDSGGRSISQ
jgi:hypothetical protein